jgi:predicted nucleic acid-binding protein
MPPSDRLIETTILVDLLRGQEAAITWVNSVSLQDRWVSVITYLELPHSIGFSGRPMGLEC